jgi:hypothetical protein
MSLLRGSELQFPTDAEYSTLDHLHTGRFSDRCGTCDEVAVMFP